MHVTLLSELFSALSIVKANQKPASFDFLDCRTKVTDLKLELNVALVLQLLYKRYSYQEPKVTSESRFILISSR